MGTGHIRHFGDQLVQRTDGTLGAALLRGGEMNEAEEKLDQKTAPTGAGPASTGTWTDDFFGYDILPTNTATNGSPGRAAARGQSCSAELRDDKRPQLYAYAAELFREKLELCELCAEGF